MSADWTAGKVAGAVVAAVLVLRMCGAMQATHDVCANPDLTAYERADCRAVMREQSDDMRSGRYP